MPAVHPLKDNWTFLGVSFGENEEEGYRWEGLLCPGCGGLIEAGNELKLVCDEATQYGLMVNLYHAGCGR